MLSSNAWNVHAIAFLPRPTTADHCLDPIIIRAIGVIRGFQEVRLHSTTVARPFRVLIPV